jgi:putative ABC transport system permease protein
MSPLFRLPPSRRRVPADVNAELSFHLEGRVEELMQTGLSREEAEQEAIRRFGDRARVEAEVSRIDVTTIERRALRDRLSAIWRDVRYAARGLARRPLFAVAVIVTLALGIGANTAIFSVVEAVLLRPFNVPNIGRLAVVRDDFPLMGLRNAGVSPLEAIDLYARKDLFTVAATSSGGEGVTIDIQGQATQISGATTTGEFFNVYGARPLLGRLYRPEDSQVGRAPVVVLSHRLWQQLGADSTMVSRFITLRDKPYQVIGVMPADFTIPRSALYWRPLVLDSVWLNPQQSRGTITHLFVGRLRDGVTMDRLRRELRVIADQWHQTYPEYKYGGHTLIAQTFVESQAGQLKPIVLALFGAVVFVLLIACANVASLQLVRSAGRARELAVRAALGAGRGAITRQLVVESLLLAIVGGLVGIALGKGALAWLTHIDVAQFPALKGLKLDGTVLAFTAGSVILAGLLFGSAPAFRAARIDVNDALRDSGRGSSAGATRHRFLRASVVAQNALTLLLLAGAALTIRSLDQLLRVDPGFQPEHVVTFTVSLPGGRYKGKEQRVAFFDALDARLKAMPGTQAVGFALGVPFTGSGGSTHYTLTGIPQLPGEPDRHANQAFVYGDFFRAMGIQIVRGRGFTPADYSGGQAAIVVDETLVKQSFGNADPLGVHIEHGPDGTIVGVARSVKLADLTEAAHPLVYHDFGHTAQYIGNLVAVVRSTLPPDQVLKTSRVALAELDPTLPFANAKALAVRVSDSLGPRRLATVVLAGFAALSLVLALFGVYAVMSYVVSQRLKEIGIRVALGAQRSSIAGMVVKDGAGLAALGLGVGALVFLGAGRLLRALLYGVGMLDPLALGASIALLGGVTLVACYLPARRAVRIDPVVTLRAE